MLPSNHFKNHFNPLQAQPEDVRPAWMKGRSEADSWTGRIEWISEWIAAVPLNRAEEISGDQIRACSNEDPCY